MIDQIRTVFPVQSFQFRQTALNPLQFARVGVDMVGIVPQGIRSVVDKNSRRLELFDNRLQSNIVLRYVPQRTLKFVQ